MAYTATVDITELSAGEYTIQIDETEVEATSEVELLDSVTGRRLPYPGRIIRCIAPPSTGTGATRQPRLAIAASASTGQVRYEATATAKATKIDEQPAVSLTAESSLFHRSQPASGTDNVCSTTYHYKVGW